MNLKSQLESLLFVSIKQLPTKELARLVNAKPKEVEETLLELAEEYKKNDRGLAIIQNNNQFQITTAPSNSALIKDFLKSEINGELSQPSLEALTIIAYRGPISKLELERIRGINCSLIIRNLLIRGLIEEKFEKAKEENYYTITIDFVRFLGLNSISELPEYKKLNKTEELTNVLEETADIDK